LAAGTETPLLGVERGFAVDAGVDFRGCLPRASVGLALDLAPALATAFFPAGADGAREGAREVAWDGARDCERDLPRGRDKVHLHFLL
jgi:hypothetical protein